MAIFGMIFLSNCDFIEEKKSPPIVADAPVEKVVVKNDTPPAKEKCLTAKKNKELPPWYAKAERTYMLNDDRVLELDQILYAGGYLPSKGEVFFIDNAEVVFQESKIKIKKEKTIITKTLSSGDYVVKIVWDTNMTTGMNSEGEISIYYKNSPCFSAPLYMSGL